MFAENPGFPRFDVALFDKDSHALPSLFYGDDRGSCHPFGNRIGIGVDREFGRSLPRFADGDGIGTFEDRGPLAFGFERQQRGHDEMRRRMRQDRSSGRGVVSGGSRGSDYQKSVAAKADAGMASDFDVERNEVASGRLDLGLVEGFAFGGQRLGIETHVEKRVFELEELRIFASEDGGVREEEPLGSEIHSEKRRAHA